MAHPVCKQLHVPHLATWVCSAHLQGGPKEPAHYTLVHIFAKY